MIAVLVAEFADWARYGSRQTLAICVCFLTLAGILTGLHPELVLLGLTAIFGGLGILQGSERWNGPKVAEWVAKAGIAGDQVMAGKALAILSIYLFHCVVLLPGVILMVSLWGIGWDTMGAMTLLFLMIYSVCAGITLLFAQLDSEMARFFGILSVLVLVAVTFAVSTLNFLNPFHQVLTILEGGLKKGSWFFFLIYLGIDILIRLTLGRVVNNTKMEVNP